MERAAGSDIEVNIKIQRELISMHATVSKIKHELHEINNIVQSDGSLDVALQNAVGSLVEMCKNSGIEVESETNAGMDNSMADKLSQISMNYITEKLKSLSQK